MKLGAWSCVAALAVGLAASAASAARTFHTFVISEVYSSADGSVQFVELREAANFSGQHLLAGHAIIATSADGTQTNTFTFPSNLPSSATANKRVLIATAGFNALPGGVAANYTIPANFLFAGGSVDFAGLSIATYAALPTNGQSSLGFPGGAAGVNSPTNFAGASGSVNVPGGSCCNGSACSLALQSACGGTFTLGGSCNPDPCGGGATGACCTGPACAISSAAGCGGAYQGDGSVCGASGNPTTCCRANFNGVGGVTVQDIFDFLAAYFNGDSAADFNGVGSVTVQDIFDYLAAYFAGCPG